MRPPRPLPGSKASRNAIGLKCLAAKSFCKAREALCQRQGLINHLRNETFCFGLRTMQCPEGNQCSIPASCFHVRWESSRQFSDEGLDNVVAPLGNVLGGIVGMGAQLGIVYGPKMLSFRDHESRARCSKECGLPPQTKLPQQRVALASATQKASHSPLGRMTSPG